MYTFGSTTDRKPPAVTPRAWGSTVRARTHAGECERPAIDALRSRMTTDAIGRTRLSSSELVDARARLTRIEDAFADRVVGQERMRRSLLVALMTQGHVLL